MTMADNTIHDLLDEVNCADSCEAVTALCALIDELLKDIQHLELECIGTRYLLSQHMEEEQGSLLRSDILENLGRRHYGSPAYQLFKELQYNGGDPMEFRDYLVKVQKACMLTLQKSYTKGLLTLLTHRETSEAPAYFYRSCGRHP